MYEEYKKVAHTPTQDFIMDGIETDILKPSVKYSYGKVTHKIGLAYGSAELWAVIEYSVPTIKF